MICCVFGFNYRAALAGPHVILSLFWSHVCTVCPFPGPPHLHPLRLPTSSVKRTMSAPASITVETAIETAIQRFERVSSTSQVYKRAQPLNGVAKMAATLRIDVCTLINICLYIYIYKCIHACIEYVHTLMYVRTYWFVCVKPRLSLNTHVVYMCTYRCTVHICKCMCMNASSFVMYLYLYTYNQYTSVHICMYMYYVRYT